MLWISLDSRLQWSVSWYWYSSSSPRVTSQKWEITILFGSRDIRHSASTHPLHTPGTCDLSIGMRAWKMKLFETVKQSGSENPTAVFDYLAWFIDKRYKLYNECDLRYCGVAVVSTCPHRAERMQVQCTIKYCEKAAFCRVVVMMVRCDCTVLQYPPTPCSRNLQEGRMIFAECRVLTILHRTCILSAPDPVTRVAKILVRGSSLVPGPDKRCVWSVNVLWVGSLAADEQWAAPAPDIQTLWYALHSRTRYETHIPTALWQLSHHTLHHTLLDTITVSDTNFKDARCSTVLKVHCCLTNISFLNLWM